MRAGAVVRRFGEVGGEGLPAWFCIGALTVDCGFDPGGCLRAMVGFEWEGQRMLMLMRLKMWQWLFVCKMISLEWGRVRSKHRCSETFLNRKQ